VFQTDWFSEGLREGLREGDGTMGKDSFLPSLHLLGRRAYVGSTIA